MSHVSRRVFVRSTGLVASAVGLAPFFAKLTPARAKDSGLTLGKPAPFTFEALVARAQKAASAAYVPPARPAPEVVKKIDYEAHGKIRFKVDHALDGGGPGLYPATFFHLGQFFQKTVKMYSLRGGQAREISYSPSYFDMPADSIAKKLPKTSGFAGFRLHESNKRTDWKTQDWVAFLGASYFRTIGSLNQYGLSSRGLAVNTTAPGGEEFPDFTEFYLESPEKEGEPVVIYALLDGPSVSGAYRFACRRTTGVVMDIECAVFMRNDVAQLGISPLTSMFWFSEYDKQFRIDWRPEVHDSDGLAMWTGAGERLWRPLNNPTRVVTSSFVDKNPRGFGLLQRDRVFEHYLDGVNYDKRPSCWVEPVGEWGAGSVQLVEIPTDDEIHDNIVAFWVPEKAASKGASFRFKYRLHWQGDEPHPADNSARVYATRIGRGGEPGKPRPKNVTKFYVEFAGKPLEQLPKDAKVEAKISTSKGKISYVFTEPVPSTRRWRAQFDVTTDGPEPVELRAYLVSGKQTLSETWMYQLEPRG
ncbi:MAG: glucan biosynthesis protein [Polyangiales bacterium]